MKTRQIIGILAGMAFVPLLNWIAGIDFPTHRGVDALCITVFVIWGGWIGYLATKPN